jgi:hypothetical protein
LRRLRGVTLMETVVVVALIAVMAGIVSRAIVFATTNEQRFDEARAIQDRERTIADSLRSLLASARLSTQGDAATAYYLAGAVRLGGDGTTSNSIVFTAMRTAPDAIRLFDGTFEEANEAFGPAAGLEEISLSLEPVGDAGERSGLFLRRQLPSDGDPTQGGTEELMVAGVESLRFEFFDGTTWVGAWDTEAQDPPRLPAAVLIAYTIENDARGEQTMIVRLPFSDATTTNPVQVGAQQ